MVLVGGASKIALELLNLAMLAEHLNRFGVQRDRTL